eukprot:EG_transcript_20765
MDDLRDGKWSKQPLTPDPYPTQCPWLQRNVSWVWEVQKPCLFVPFSADFFCDLMAGRSLLFIGDSLTLETSISLLGLLTGKFLPYEQRFTNLPGGFVQKVEACSGVNKGSLFGFVRDEHLTNTRWTIKQMTPFPAVLVLNTGAHYIGDTEVSANFNKSLIPSLVAWHRQCQKTPELRGRCLLVWRTTVPGHTNCSTLTEPFPDAAAALPHTVPPVPLWNWDKFKAQNRLMLRLLRKAQLPLYVIDAYHINLLRGDGHAKSGNDCLHYCLPGPPDVYNRALQHALFLAAQGKR